MNGLTALPVVIIKVDGVPLVASDALALGEVRVQQRVSLPALCELVFRNPPGPLTLDSRFGIGVALQVRLEGQRLPLFEGEVTALEMVYEPSAGQAFHVRAYDRLHRLRKHAPIRAHVDMTLAELARELVEPLSIAVQGDEGGAGWAYMIQHRHNDLDFLRDRAERSGVLFALYGATLHLFTFDGFGETVPLRLGHTLLEARFEVNADLTVAEVGVSGWDTESVQMRSGSATSARLGRSVGATVPPSTVGADYPRYVTDLRLESDRQAEAVAQSELDRRAAQEVVLSGTSNGDTRLRPGTPVDVSGVASAFNGRYVLTSVTHRIDSELGYLCELSSAPPSPIQRPHGTIATLGVVTQIDDPEALGRVRVSLPTFGDVTTFWVHVVSAGAGGGKGLMMLPDVGDEVLVLVSDEDLAQAVVVGGLYGGRGTPDSGIEGGAVQRYSLLTPGGQRVTLDDSRGTIRLENRDGSFVEMTPERVHIHAAVDLEIEAPGRAIVVRGDTIDFQRG